MVRSYSFIQLVLRNSGRFGVVAENGKEAAQIARAIPRCKHHHKDCIREVTKISYEEFLEINANNDEDPYLKCSSIQEQRNIDMSERLYDEDKPKEVTRACVIHKVYNGKTKVRKPKKYVRFNAYRDSYCYKEFALL